MTKNKVIAFQPKERMIQKALLYVNDSEQFLNEIDTAVPLLLKVFKRAGAEFKDEIIFLLGGVAQNQVIWPLYEIMTDTGENEVTRHSAASQISVTAAFLEDTADLTEKLLMDIEGPDPVLRRLAAFAVGWEKNEKAAIPLIGLMYDDDPDIQKTAVNALANLRDGRLLKILLDRLEHGPQEQKRAILFNLWRFSDRREEVIQVYLKHLDHKNESLRFVTLAVFDSITEAKDYIPIYRRCLRDPYARVRELALKRLTALSVERLTDLRDRIKELSADPDRAVKKAATALINKLK